MGVGNNMPPGIGYGNQTQRMAMEDINRLQRKNEQRKKVLSPFKGMGAKNFGDMKYTKAAINMAMKFLGRE